MNKNRVLYGAMSVGGVIGLAASFMQTLEKLQLLKQTDKPLVCDLNGVFSCSNVLHAWQSSVFGFPNSLMCLVFFTIFTIVGLAGLSGASLPRSFRLSVQALALFVLGFGLWFLWQSIYVIGSLCVLCIFCLAGLLLVNASLMRVNAGDIFSNDQAQSRLAQIVASGADIFVWFFIAITVTFAALLHFW